MRGAVHTNGDWLKTGAERRERRGKEGEEREGRRRMYVTHTTRL